MTNNVGNPDAQHAPDELLADRLRFLIGSRSTRAAAKDWQLSYSTLNNYINRGTEPSLSVAMQIARLEGVSVEWLAYGTHNSEPPRTAKECDTPYQVPSQTEDSLISAWSMVFQSLNHEERGALLQRIHQAGVGGLLDEHLLRHDLARHIDTLSPRQKTEFYTRALQLVADIKQATDE